MSYYSKLRSFIDKKTVYCFCEKTPENLHFFEEFVDGNSSALGVAIVRNGYDVILSLMRRGFSLYNSLAIFLSQSYALIESTRRSNLRIVKYEAVVLDPFKEISKLANDLLAININELDIEANFKENARRREIAHPKSWLFSPSCVYPPDQISAAHKGKFDIPQLSWLRNVSLYDSDTGSKLCSFDDIQSFFNYELHVPFDGKHLHQTHAEICSHRTDGNPLFDFHRLEIRVDD